MFFSQGGSNTITEDNKIRSPLPGIFKRLSLLYTFDQFIGDI
jgi:hypothetical protein